MTSLEGSSLSVLPFQKGILCVDAFLITDALAWTDSACWNICVTHVELRLGHQRLAKPKLQNNPRLNVLCLNPHQRLGFSILNYQHVTPSMTVMPRNSVLQHVIQAVLAYFCIFGSWPQGRAIVAVTPRPSFPEQIKRNDTLKRHAEWIVRACVRAYARACVIK